MFKKNSGRKQENGVWQYFRLNTSTNKSKCIVKPENSGVECGALLKGKNAKNLCNHLRIKHKAVSDILVEKETQLKDSKRKQLISKVSVVY